MRRGEWLWMPHAGHFICGDDCKFHLNTWVGNFIVSTVGEYFPDGPVREILADCRGIKLEGMGDARKADYMKKIGYQDLGCDRKYETMVFQASEFIPNSCCPYRAVGGLDLEMKGYNTPEEAVKGHWQLCTEWAPRKLNKENSYK